MQRIFDLFHSKIHLQLNKRYFMLHFGLCTSRPIKCQKAYARTSRINMPVSCYYYLMFIEFNAQCSLQKLVHILSRNRFNETSFVFSSAVIYIQTHILNSKKTLNMVTRLLRSFRILLCFREHAKDVQNFRVTTARSTKHMECAVFIVCDSSIPSIKTVLN